MMNNPNQVAMATSTSSTNNATASGNTNQNKKKRNNTHSNLSRNAMANKNEVSHYVVTAHPPGSVALTCTCNFLSNQSVDVLVAKPRRIEVRQLQSHHHQPATTTSIHDKGDEKATNQSLSNNDAFPIVLQLSNINGNIVAMEPLRPFPAKYFETTPVFILQERFRYAVIQYNSNMTPYPVVTHASGSLASGSSDPTSSSGSSTTHIHSIAHLVGRIAETAPIVAVDPECRCIVLHLYDGLLTIIPINKGYVPTSSTMKNLKSDHRNAGKQPYQAHQTSSSSMLGEPFHCRIEERTILALSFLQTASTNVDVGNSSLPNTIASGTILPLVCVLHQDSRGLQHITSHTINIRKRQLHLYNSQSVHSQTPWLKKSSVDGGSSILISVPPPMMSLSVAAASTAVGSATLLSAAPSSTTSMPVDQHQQKQPPASSSLANQPLLCGGILILGQRQFTYVSPGNTSNSYKIVPVPQALYLSYDRLPDDPVTNSPRYLIGDEFGNLHMLSILYVRQPTSSGSNGIPRVIALQLETLGSCSISSALSYLGRGLCYIGSALGDSQLIQIHDEPLRSMATAAVMNSTKTGMMTDETAMSLDEDYEYSQHYQTSEGGLPEDVLVDLMDTTYISVVEEYTNLGPILDFDLVPTTPGSNRGTTSTMADNSSNSNGLDPKIPNEASASTGTVSSWNQNNGSYQYQQSQVVTASGTSRSGTIRVIRNGIGMNEYASVAMTGIQAMWSVRKSFYDPYDTYLVQSFVGETRVLGVSSTKSSNDEEMMQNDPTDDVKNLETQEADGDQDGGGMLEEVILPGLEPSASLTLYVGNVQCGDRLLQITESEVLLIANSNETDSIPDNSHLLDTWSGDITVASANEAGQIVIAMAGGQIVYLSVVGGNKITKICDKQMDREVSCINLNPFVPSSTRNTDNNNTSTGMDIDGISTSASERLTFRSSIVAVGLWDDFTVRLLSLDNELDELASLPLSSAEDDDDDAADVAAPKDPGTGSFVSNTNQRKNRNNMMARSLCLITLDIAASLASSNTNDGIRNSNYHERLSNHGVNMLFVGLGDGTLISFAVAEVMGVVQAQSRKEVCLGTQCISLVPLNYVFSSTLGATDHIKSHQQHHRSGACVLATGDRPTVIYLAGVGGSYNNTGHQLNPKLCYSNVNVTTSNLEDDINNGSRPPSQQAIVVNVAAPFYSPLLFGEFVAGIGSHQQYSLCVADDANLRLGVIDDIQKLHVTTCRLGMAPRRIVHCPDGRLFAVGCIESGIKQFGFLGDEGTMGNCIRFIDDTTFDDLDRVDLEPFEMILSMVYATMNVPCSAADRNTLDSVVTLKSTDVTGSSQGSGIRNQELKPFLLVGTGYALPDEDEPTRGRILVYSCQTGKDVNTGTNGISGRLVRQIAEFTVEGGVYSLTQFFDGLILASVNSRTHICQLAREDGPGGMLNLQYVGNGHFGHILSLFLKCRAKPSVDAFTSCALDLPSDQTANNVESKSIETKEEMIAIVGDLMRSISLVQYFPQHQTLEEIARDFNVNWTTAIEMLTDSVYLGAENWNNFFCLRRNTASSSEEVRCRLDTIGEYHFGEMCNKFMSGSLVMPVSTSANTKSLSRRSRPLSPSKKSESASPANKIGSTMSRVRRPVVVTGSQTLFGTANGTLGIVLGMDAGTAAFFSTLERAMANPKVIRPIGDFLHSQYRACHAERRIHPAHGFVDGDLVESFLDLDRFTMEAVVAEINRDGGWEIPVDVSTPKDDKEPNSGDGDNRLELAVDDVLAMVEEMTMLH